MSQKYPPMESLLNKAVSLSNDSGWASNANGPGRWLYLFSTMVFDLWNGTSNRTVRHQTTAQVHSLPSLLDMSSITNKCGADSHPSCSQDQKRHRYDEKSDVKSSTHSNDSAPPYDTHDARDDADSCKDNDEYAHRWVDDGGTSSAISTIEDDLRLTIEQLQEQLQDMACDIDKERQQTNAEHRWEVQRYIDIVHGLEGELRCQNDVLQSQARDIKHLEAEVEIKETYIEERKELVARAQWEKHHIYMVISEIGFKLVKKYLLAGWYISWRVHLGMI
ncbi:hypothetical protein EV702DRAFT_1053388 [Suillus placidus]|uniref:Uncharacterized protein n=1 Tax=Suillus placidus TaxID=48579 RepID=A0A9P7CVH7_9AGAM|nr:hypothetical protein EV702DRAFT_1053388 [Suillus placidus]